MYEEHQGREVKTRRVTKNIKYFFQEIETETPGTEQTQTCAHTNARAQTHTGGTGKDFLGEANEHIHA